LEKFDTLHVSITCNTITSAILGNVISRNRALLEELTVAWLVKKFKF
jgi:hypothetical protein